MNKLHNIVLMGLAISITGCISTPEPNPVSVKQPGDTELPCKYLEAEYKGNTEAAVRKISKNNDGDAKDAVLGLLIWPGLADFNNAPGHEGNALLDRNSWLKSLADVKKCDTQSWTAQPKRY